MTLHGFSLMSLSSEWLSKESTMCIYECGLSKTSGGPSALYIPVPTVRLCQLLSGFLEL